MDSLTEPSSLPGPKLLVKVESVLVTLSIIAILTMGALITVSIFTRAVFSYSIPDSTIIVRELMIAAVVLPLAYVTASRSHILVEVFSAHLPDRFQPWLDFLSAVIGLAALIPIVYGGYVEFIGVLEDGAYFFGELELPEWPGRAAFVAGYCVFVVRLAVLVIVDFLAALRGRDPVPQSLDQGE